MANSGSGKAILVWAKLGRFPYWPSKTTEFSELPKQIAINLPSSVSGSQLVYFFGSNNYNWVPENQVIDFEKGFDEYSKSKNTKTFRQALKQAHDWRDGKLKITHEDEEDSEDEKPTKKKKKRKKKQRRNVRKPSGKKGEEKREQKRKTDEDKKKKKEEQQKKKAQQQEESYKQDINNNDEATNGKKDSSSKKRKLTEVGTVSQTERKKLKETISDREEGSIKDTPRHSLSTEPEPGDVEQQSDPDNDFATPAKLQPKNKLNSVAISSAIRSITRHPISKYHKFDVVTYGAGYATCKAVYSDARNYSKFEVHCSLGSAYFLLDITCFAALVMLLREGDTAITQDIHVTVMTPISPGSEVIIKAKVQHSKENLIFMDGEIFLGGKCVIACRVIKSTTEPYVVAKEMTSSSKME